MRTHHQDIRIGTLAPMNKGVGYLRQLLPHGFESFQLTIWKYLEDIHLADTARQVRELLDDKAVISSVGLFGNPLQDQQTAGDIAKVIDAARLFGCDVFAGFAGAIEGRPVPESMPVFKNVWGDLARRAADQGVRIAFENCNMDGDWNNPRLNIAHAPDAWAMIFHELPFENIGLCWEPCHQMVSLIDPMPQLRELAANRKIFHLHGKDATIDWNAIRRHGIRGNRPYVWHRTPGFGDTNWTDVISILRQHAYRGSIDIEGWHDPVYRDELETTGQVHALNYLKQCRGGLFVPNPT